MGKKIMRSVREMGLQMLMKNDFSPCRATTRLFSRIGSAQLTLILSGVAGLCSERRSSTPQCFRAAFKASRMAKKTAEPMKRGG